MIQSLKNKEILSFVTFTQISLENILPFKVSEL